jgi:hypothetical protein
LLFEPGGNQKKKFIKPAGADSTSIPGPWALSTRTATRKQERARQKIMESLDPRQRKYHCLWNEEKNVGNTITTSQEEDSGAADNNDDDVPAAVSVSTQASFLSARSVEPVMQLLHPGSAMPTRRRPRQSFVSLWSNTLVVGQEVALSCLVLARHQCLVGRTTANNQNDNPSSDDDQVRSNAMISLVLILILYFSQKMASQTKDDSVNQKQYEQQKRMGRTVDAILLACILRLVASVLQSLTASYSSDTVAALAIGGMVVHVFACDYPYANGQLRRLQANNDDTITTATTSSFVYYRPPPFQGGTMSLNAALFSTTLLASRISSNLVSYGFISTCVVAFAFYPTARNRISSATTNSSNKTRGKAHSKRLIQTYHT